MLHLHFIGSFDSVKKHTQTHIYIHNYNIDDIYFSINGCGGGEMKDETHTCYDKLYKYEKIVNSVTELSSPN